MSSLPHYRKFAALRIHDGTRTGWIEEQRSQTVAPASELDSVLRHVIAVSELDALF